MRANLFDYATSELSQDAVLCWMAHWADPALEPIDPSLHRLGVSFLNRMVALHGKEISPVQTLNIKKQFKNMDIVVEINGSIIICIEDKRGSKEHSNQLTRYVQALRETYPAPYTVLPVYVQTWDQGSYNPVVKSGFRVFNRQELCGLLREYRRAGGTNSIAIDFHDHLMRLDSQFLSYRDIPPQDWNSFSWMGFYSELQARMGTGEWGFVPNAAGGFYGFWWEWTGRLDGAEPYLQLEERKLCFKIDASEEPDLQAARSEWSRNISQAAAAEGLPVRKPDRLRPGKTMTIQVLESDYLKVGADGRLDLDATVALLQSASRVLRRFNEAPEPSQTVSS